MEKILSPSMQKALDAAEAYDDWFCICHGFLAPVPARHQTIRALYKLGLLEYVKVATYNAMGQPNGAYGKYRAVKRLESQR